MDLFGVLESQGVPAIRLPLGKKAAIDGLALYGRTLGAFILVNSSVPLERQAFIASHEYCHVLKDREECFRYDAPDEIHDPRPGRSPMVTVANAFAAEFVRDLLLVPASEGFAVSRGYFRLAKRAFDARKITQSRLKEITRSGMG